MSKKLFENMSFANQEYASIMAIALSKKNNSKYDVIIDNNLGFTVIKNAETVQNPSFGQNLNNKLSRLEKMSYRQSIKGFIEHIIELLFGLFLIFRPFTVIGWILDLMDINTIPEWLNLSMCGETLKAAGYILSIYGIRLVYSYYSLKLFFEQDAMILKKGIIAQDHIQIRFLDIKTVGIRQSILERILNIGTLHLASAGTNGEVDIVFKNLINPVYMRQRIQRLIQENSKN